MTEEEKYMNRCLQLAALGTSTVAPNPMVGAVLVYNNRVIGEGYHRQYGGDHAEINCLASVKVEDRQYIAKAVMYVSLEPCAHFGKTPPCVDAIIKNKIPHVVIACRDSFAAVNGKGIQKLKDAGVKITENILQQQAINLNKRFFTFHSLNRPYIILKWAKSANGFIAGANKSRVKITNELTDKLVHKWRSEEAAIMVGTNTALIDNPALNNRYWNGKNPVRVIIDLNLKLPSHLQLFDGKSQTIIINFSKHEKTHNLLYQKIDHSENRVASILAMLQKHNLTSVIVEGGAQLLQSLIRSGTWDEARVITNQSLMIKDGLSAPQLMDALFQNEQMILNDQIRYYQNQKQQNYFGAL